MKIKITYLLLLFSFFIISCDEKTDEEISYELEDILQQPEMEPSIDNLKGRWETVAYLTYPELDDARSEAPFESMTVRNEDYADLNDEDANYLFGLYPGVVWDEDTFRQPVLEVGSWSWEIEYMTNGILVMWRGANLGAAYEEDRPGYIIIMKKTN